MLADYFTRTPISKKDQNICCNHVVVPDFVPIVSFTSKDKLVYIPPHKRNQKVERKTLNPKPSFRSQLKVLDGSKFVPNCHYCGVIGHIRPQCSLLKKKQNHVARSLFKRPCEHKPIVCHHCGAFGHLRPHYSKFQTFNRIKRKEKLEFLGSCAMKAKSNLEENGKLLRHSLSMCICHSHSSNPHLISYETLIPNNHSVWMRKDSYG